MFKFIIISMLTFSALALGTATTKKIDIIKPNTTSQVEVVGELVTGNATINGQLVVASTTEASKPYPTMTEVERDALTPSNGEMIYNSDTSQLNIYDGADWQLVAGGGGGVGKWITLVEYVIDDVIWLEADNKIYRCITDNTDAVFTPAKWIELSSGAGTLQEILDGGATAELPSMMQLKDNATPIIGSLFEIADTLGTTAYMAVSIAQTEVIKLYTSTIDSLAGISFEIAGVASGLFDGAWKYLDADNVMKEAGRKYGVSFTYDGFSEYNSASVWSNGNDIVFGSGAGGAAVTKVTSGALFGQTSAYEVSGAVLNDWVSIPYTASGVDELNEIAFKYNVATTGHWESRVTCDAPIIDASNDNATLWSANNKGRVTYTNVSSNTACIMGFQCVTAACDTFRFNNKSVSSQVDSRVNLVEQGSINWLSNGSDILFNLDDSIRFTTLSDSDFSGNGLKMLSYDTTTAKFKALKDATLNLQSNLTITLAGWNFILYLNGVQVASSTNENAGDYLNLLTYNFPVKAGDEFWFQKTVGSITQALTNNVSITATATSEKVSHATDTSDVDIVVEGRGCTGCAVTADTTPIPFTEVQDTASAWDGNTFTAPEDGIYRINGKTDSTAGSTYYSNAWLDKGVGFVEDAATGTTSVSGAAKNFNYTFVAKKGWKFQLRSTNSHTMDNDLVFHWIFITKQKSNAGYVVVPTEENEIKEKFLSSTNSSAVDMPDLTFTGLEIGKWYEITGQITGFDNSAGNVGAKFRSAASGAGVVYGYSQMELNTGNLLTSVSVSVKFQALSNTLYTRSYVTSGAVIYGNSTKDQTFLQLQKLPDESGLVTGKFAKVRTCYLKDKRDNGQDGGTTTALTWENRKFDSVIEGDCGFVIKGVLTSNSAFVSNFYFEEFALDAGKYDISCAMPVFKSTSHQARLLSDPNGSPVVTDYGRSSYTESTTNVQTDSLLEGHLNNSVSVEYNVQHNVSASKSNNGFGVRNPFGGDQVYGTCKITQILAR